MSREREIELTFLARFIPDEIKGVEPVFYEDIYIPEESDFAVLRLRKKGSEYEITKKIPVIKGDFSAHVEHTINLSEDEYKALENSSRKYVSKLRYRVNLNGYDAEVDIFTGDMKGLVVIDFEFDSNEDKDKFIPPSCCFLDVTQERTILGGQLAGLKYSDIEEWLFAKGYRKLTV